MTQATDIAVSAETPGAQKRIDLDGILKTLQVVVLAGTAAAGIFTYFSFDAATRKASLDDQLKKAQISQLELVAKRDRHLEYRSAMRIGLIGDESTVQLQGGSIRWDQLGERDRAPTDARNVKPSGPSSVAVTSTSTATGQSGPVESIRAGLSFSLLVKNPTALPVEIFRNRVRLFVGHFKSVEGVQAFAINQPPDGTTPISWGDAAVDETYVEGKGGNTGVLGSNQDSQHTYDFVVSVRRGDWIAVRADLSVGVPVEADGTSKTSPVEQVVMRFCSATEGGVWECTNDEPVPQEQRQDRGGGF